MESVKASYPFWSIRLLGGVLFLSGMVIMFYNVLKTIAGEKAYNAPVLTPQAAPRLITENFSHGSIETRKFIERSVGWMIVLTLLVDRIGGLVEIVPLFFQKSTTTPVEGLKPTIRFA